MSEDSIPFVEPLRVLVSGRAAGPTLVLEEPLSLWGGLDPATGKVIDVRHPQRGLCLTGCVVVMPRGRGSSSASSVLLEAIRRRTAPAALVLSEVDPILALGAAVGRELYGRGPSVVVMTPDDHRRLGRTEQLQVEESGRVGPGSSESDAPALGSAGGVRE